MNIFSNIKNVLIIVLILVGAYFAYRWFTQPPGPDMNNYIEIGGKEYIELSRNIDTLIVRDTVRVPEYIPKIKYVDREVEVPADVDTLAILKDYHVKRYYEDTVKQYPDSSGGNSVTVKDTISKNRIISRQVDFNVETNTIKETLTVLEPPKVKAFIGGGVTLGNQGVGANGALLIKNRKDDIIGGRVGIMNVPGTNELTPYVGIEYYIKLSFKKKNRR